MISTKMPAAAVYYPQMGLNIIMTGFLAVHASLGGLCMMPRAPMPDMHAGAPERHAMAMTPAQPMSPAHCDDCAHANLTEPKPVGMSCEGGQCMLQDTTTVASARSMDNLFPASHLPAPERLAQENNPFPEHYAFSIVDPPPKERETVVLLL